MERVDLEVPYLEKDEAKALGAKWDQQNKTWYIYDSMSQKPFEKWLPKSKTYIYIAVAEKKCWKCGNNTTVIALGVPYGKAYELDEYDISEGAYPGYDPSAYEALALLPRIDSMPKELRDYLEATYNYKPKYSKTTGLTQLNNCCDSCGALIGEFFEFDDPCGCFFIGAEEDLETLSFYKIELPGMIYGLLDRWSPFDSLALFYAQHNAEEIKINLIENLFI